MPATASTSAKDFFISYTQADRRWAEWVAWQLEEAGYAVIIQAWDFAAGANFLKRMDTALKEAGRTLLILTPEALDSRFLGEEWTAALHQERLVPVRVRACNPTGLLGPRVYIDLVGLAENEARERLLAELKKGRRKPDRAPTFPGAVPEAERSVPQKPAFPGALPPFWQVPYPRNPAFTGRKTLLAELHRALSSGEVAALTQAITGLGGTSPSLYPRRFCSGPHSTQEHAEPITAVSHLERGSRLAGGQANSGVHQGSGQKGRVDAPVVIHYQLGR